MVDDKRRQEAHSQVQQDQHFFWGRGIIGTWVAIHCMHLRWTGPWPFRSLLKLDVVVTPREELASFWKRRDIQDPFLVAQKCPSLNISQCPLLRRSSDMLCRESWLGVGGGAVFWQLFDALSRRFAPRQGKASPQIVGAGGVFVSFRIFGDVLCCSFAAHSLLISLNHLSLQELVSTALRECGSALRFVPVPLRRDREVVLVAVQNDGEALFYAPPELQAGPLMRHHFLSFVTLVKYKGASYQKWNWVMGLWDSARAEHTKAKESTKQHLKHLMNISVCPKMGYPWVPHTRVVSNIIFSSNGQKLVPHSPVEADAEVAGAAVAQVGQACENHRRSWWQSKGVKIIQCWCYQPQHQSSPSNDLCLINFDHVFSLDTELSI